MKHLLQKHLETIILYFLFALPGTEVRIYFFVFLSILTPKITILYPQSPFRYSQKSVSVRFGSQKSVSVIRESVSVSTKVRFGPFRSVPVRFGPFRMVYYIATFAVYFSSDNGIYFRISGGDEPEIRIAQIIIFELWGQ